jgi:monoterpene epsilon-lactone hydrolase
MKTSKLTTTALLNSSEKANSANAHSIPDSTMVKISQERAYYETLGKNYPPAENVPITETSIAGVKSFWFNQELADQKRIILYLHGGVYALGNINAYSAMLSHFSQDLNAAILYVEYALAPEATYPFANHEILNVYKELKNKYPDCRFTVMGDSAGGGLAITLVHNSMEANIALPDSLALISPWIDLKTNNNSYQTRQAVDPILSKEMLDEHANLYAPNNLIAADPSELKFTNFPPVFLLVGTDEVLNDDARNFYKVIKPIQEKAALKEYAGQKHVWPVSDIHSKESVAAINDIKQFLLANE